MSLTGADHDDVPTVARGQQLDCGIAAVVHTMHVDVEAAVPVFVIEFSDRGERLHRAGIVHEDVQPTEDLLGPIDESADFRPIGHIRHNHLGPPASA